MKRRKVYKREEWHDVRDYDLLIADELLPIGFIRRAMKSYENAGGTHARSAGDDKHLRTIKLATTWVTPFVAKTNGRSLQRDDIWCVRGILPPGLDDVGTYLRPFDMMTVSRRDGTMSNHVAVRSICHDEGFCAYVVDAPESDSEDVSSYVYRLLEKHLADLEYYDDAAMRFLKLASSGERNAWLTMSKSEQATELFKSEFNRVFKDASDVIRICHAVDRVLLDEMKVESFDECR